MRCLCGFVTGLPTTIFNKGKRLGINVDDFALQVPVVLFTHIERVATHLRGTHDGKAGIFIAFEGGQWVKNKQQFHYAPRRCLII